MFRRWLACILLVACVFVALPASAQSLPGQWDWGAGGGVVTIAADGTGRDSRGNTMTWRLRDAATRLYTLRWSHGFTDEARLSADGREVAIVNNVGTRFIATRRTGATPSGDASRSPWTSLRPGSGALPLPVTAGTGFAPGRYAVFVANSDPNGTAVASWTTHGPIQVRAGDVWSATLLPSADLRLVQSAPMGGSAAGAGRATIQATNGDSRAWQSICVLPEGRTPRPDCFGGSGNVRDAEQSSLPTTFSRWTAITPYSGHVSGQPGGVMPLRVENDVNFGVGKYVIHIANADPHGHTVSRWTTVGPVDLQAGDKVEAVLLPNVRIRLSKGSPALNSYPTPDGRHAMIWARNEDPAAWQALCVLPVAMTVEDNCFGGSSNVVYAPPDAAPPAATTFSRWTAFRPAAERSPTQPGGLMPLRIQNDVHFVVGLYTLFVANADPAGTKMSAWNSFGPVALAAGDRYAAVLVPGARVRLEKDGLDLASFGKPDAKHAMIWARNDDPSSWQAICVLPAGMKPEEMCGGGAASATEPAPVPATTSPPPPPPPSPPQRLPETVTYEGEFRYHLPDKPQNVAVAPLTLTLKGNALSGTWVREGRTDLTEGRVEGQMTGRRTADGQVTGTIEGRSQSQPRKTGSSMDAGLGLLVSGLATFPFVGTFEGRLGPQAGSGKLVIHQRGNKPKDNYWTGSWTATRRPVPAATR